MGRRTDGVWDFIRFLRTTDPKHSFEVFIFNIVVGAAALACVILGETRWGMGFSVVLWVSLGIHWFRLRRVVKRQLQELAWLERMVPQIEQALADYEQAMDAARHKTNDAETARLLLLLQDDVEQAQEREADSR